MKNKVLAMLLALCMVMALLPVSVFAAACDKGSAATGACEGAAPHDDGCVTNCTGDSNDTCATANTAGAIHKNTCITKCTNATAADATCSNDATEGARHQATCNANCDETADCTATNHKTGCLSLEEDDGGDDEEDEELPQCECYNVLHKSGGVGAVKITRCEGDVVANGLCAACAKAGHKTGIPTCSSATTAGSCPVAGFDKDVNGNAITHTAACIENCTGEDENCTAENHKDGCPVKAAQDALDAALEAGTAAMAEDVEVELELACECAKIHVNGAHTDVEIDEFDGGCTNKVKVKTTVTFAYDVEDEGDTQVLTTDPVGYGTYDEALEAAKEKKAAELDTANLYLCTYCKAAAVAGCTGNIDCEAQAHNGDCLVVCKTHFGASCPNTAGDAAAHAIKYVICADGAATGDVEDTDYFWTLEGARAKRSALETEMKSAYTTAVDEYDEAVEALKTANAGDDAEAKATAAAAVATKKTAMEDAYTALMAAWVDYTVKAVHCPKSGEVDNTVIAAEGSTVAPADETKAPEKAEDFEDVPENAWYAEELTALMEKGIFKGSIDGGKYSFKPGDKMTTSTLVVLLSRVLDKGLNTEGANWDKEATEWAAKDGLTEGVEAGEITRKDVILVMWRAAGSPESEQDLSKFEDAADLEGDYLTAMKWAVENEIIKGNDKGQLNADSVIIRSEMVAVIARFDGVVNK